MFASVFLVVKLGRRAALRLQVFLVFLLFFRFSRCPSPQRLAQGPVFCAENVGRNPSCLPKASSWIPPPFPSLLPFPFEIFKVRVSFGPKFDDQGALPIRTSKGSLVLDSFAGFFFLRFFLSSDVRCCAAPRYTPGLPSTRSPPYLNLSPIMQCPHTPPSPAFVLPWLLPSSPALLTPDHDPYHQTPQTVRSLTLPSSRASPGFWLMGPDPPLKYTLTHPSPFNLLRDGPLYEPPFSRTLDPRPFLQPISLPSTGPTCHPNYKAIFSVIDLCP